MGAGKGVGVCWLPGPGRLEQESEGGAGLVLAGQGQGLRGRRDPRQEQVRSVHIACFFIDESIIGIGNVNKVISSDILIWRGTPPISCSPKTATAAPTGARVGTARRVPPDNTEEEGGHHN